MKKILPIMLIVFFTFTFQVSAAEPIKILLVPGHDNEVWGAQYGNVKEAAMNLAVASRIYDILKKDKRFDVYITRDINGYTKEFTDYFSLHRDEISAFKEDAKAEMQNKISSGNFLQKENNPHLNASEDIALRLYGFNKWANENKIDAMIHIHFNDYPRAQKWTIGKYTGIVIYIPEEQMANSKESVLLAANILTQLRKKYHISTFEKEKNGLVPDQTLIALGSNGSLLESVRSVLVEYGYVYEKKFRNYTTRHQAYNDTAKLTATGIKNYFFGE